MVDYIKSLEQEVHDLKEMLEVYKGVCEKQGLELKLLQEHVSLAQRTIEILIEDEQDEVAELLQGV